jgi:hypothetical protein
MKIFSSLGVDFDDVYCIIDVSAYAVCTYEKSRENKPIPMFL